MLTKEVVTGLISILETMQLQVREDTIIKEDTIEISRTYMRTSINPGEDVSGKSKIVQDLAALLWTDEVIASWKIKEQEQIPKFSPPAVE